MTVIPDPDNPFYSVDTVANMFGVSTYTVRGWIKDGKLTATKMQGRWRVQRSDCIKLANEEHG
jgi:excisionase family DNA binding protein